MLTLDELQSHLINDSVVLQPTTLCNLNCSYCYLPERRSQFVMSVEVTQALAEDFEQRSNPVKVLWHGGEPLATGVEAMRALLEPFERLREAGRIKHTLQTNGTLLDEDWIQLLKRYDFSVGVSIDGPDGCNDARVTWASHATLTRVVQGITLLRKAKMRFGILLVVSEHNVNRARDVYNFVVDLGCRSIGINIEEAEGLNRANGLRGESVSEFWAELLDAWLERPTIQIREFRQALGWIRGVLQSQPGALEPRSRELYPTVNWQGDVVLLSPEFIGTGAKERQQFVVGNVLETPLSIICKRSRTEVDYVTAFLRGIQHCEATCSYYSYCRGGTASNKYYETGSVEATVTNFCRNHKQRLVDVILDRATKESRPHE